MIQRDPIDAELDRLRDENLLLRQQLAALQASRAVLQAALLCGRWRRLDGTIYAPKT